MEPAELENSGEVHTEYAGDDPTVTEVYLTEEEVTNSVSDKLICIPGNTRALIPVKAQSMSRGGKIIVIVSCDNEHAVFRVNVKNIDTGEMEYFEGNDAEIVIYPITADGRYAVYVENRTGQTIRVFGKAIYSK